MARKSLRSTPTVRGASEQLVTALGHLLTASSRWLALQPAANQVPVQAERARRASADGISSAGTWAGRTATEARARGASAASTARTQLVNLVILGLVLWGIDRMLRSEED